MTASAERQCLVCGRPTGLGLQCPDCVVGAARPQGPRDLILPVLAQDERGVTEAEVARECDAALELAGWEVYKIGISDAGRVYQTPGLPDRLIFRYSDMIWLEYKRPVHGYQSTAQRDFQRRCEAAGVRYVLATGLADIADLLQPRGKQ